MILLWVSYFSFSAFKSVYLFKSWFFFFDIYLWLWWGIVWLKLEIIYFYIDNEDLSSQSKPTQSQSKYPADPKITAACHDRWPFLTGNLSLASVEYLRREQLLGVQ